MFKKFLTSSLSFTLLFTSFFTPTQASFADVDPTATFAQAVQWLENIGAVHSGRRFNPDSPLTRSQFLKMAFTAAGLKDQTFPLVAPAADVPAKIWFSPFVAQALKIGAFDLDHDGLFRPDKQITLLEAMKASMTLWGIGIPPKVDEGISLPNVKPDAWFAPLFFRAQTLNLLSPTDFPFQRLIRADGADLLFNFHFVAGDSISSPDVPTIQIDLGTTSQSDDRLDQLLHVWQLIQNSYLHPEDLSDQNQTWGAISGLVDSIGDPHSTFIPPAQQSDFLANLEQEITGIGAHVDMENGQLTIIAPVPDSPADRAGILARDIIIRVDDTDITGFPKMKSVDLIRGPIGQPVTITIRRPSTGQTFELLIIRELIDEQTVSLEIMERNFAKIRITQFTSDTSHEFSQVVSEILAKGTQIRGIILDLRNNPGGYLDSALEVSSYFLKKDEIITKTRDKNNQGQDYKASADGELATYKTVILVNEGSASAAEIMAGALSQNRGSVLIGSVTFGKGTAQVLQNLPDGSILKLTIAEWLLPDGTPVNHQGLTPDILIPDNPATVLDEQMNRALVEIRK